MLELWDGPAGWTWLGYKMKYSFDMTLGFIIAYVGVFILGCVGNSSVVLVVVKNIRMRSSPTNIFIVNLAVADLLVIVLCIPFTLISTLTVEWHLGQWICKLVPYFQGVSVNASINTLMAISVERCLSICYPMNPVGRGICWRVVMIIWSVSLTITLPWAIYFDLQPMEIGSENQICLELWPTPASGNVYFVVANLVLCYILPLSVIAACYMLIWKKVSCRQVPGEPMHNGANMVQRSKMRVITMIMYVVVLFALSWLPLYLTFSLIKFCSLPPVIESYAEKVLPFAQWLGALNSSINPLMYAILNKRFRVAYMELFRGNLCGTLDYSNSIKYLTSRAGTALKRKKPKIRKTIGPIYVHADSQPRPASGGDGVSFAVPAAGQTDADRAARPRSLSVKGTTRANVELLADSVVQYQGVKYGNAFV